MKRILLPTDFSENAWNAINYAVRLHENMSAEFYVLNSYQVNRSNLSSKINKERGTSLFEITADESNQRLITTLKTIKKTYKDPDHSFQVFSVAESLEKSINHLVVTKDIELVVMGTKGATGLKEIFLGSNTVNVIKRIDDIPIIVVPDIYNFQEPKTIIFSTDFKEFYKKETIDTLLSLAYLHSSEIKILHIKEENELSSEQLNNKRILESYLVDQKYAVVELEQTDKVSNMICDFLVREKAELMVIIKHKHGFLEKLINEQIVKKIAFHTEVPMLVLPEVN